MAGMISLFPVYQFIVIIFMIIGIIRILKWKGVFTDDDQTVFDKIVTELAVPAVIFSAFATYDFSYETLVPAGILFLALVVSLALAYGICRICRFPPKVTGTIVMISAFGSTATLASPLMISLFSATPGVVEQGVVIGVIGVAFPFFTLGVLIASHFGAKEAGRNTGILDTLKDFLETPIFISFLLGMGVSVLLTAFRIPGADGFIDIFTHFFTIISLSLNLLIWIAIGLMLRPVSLKSFLPLFAIVAVIKLFFEPVLTSFIAFHTGQPMIIQQVLLLESAVPSGAIAAVLASRYGCDSTLAGWMIVGTYLVSLVSIPLLFLILPA